MTLAVSSHGWILARALSATPTVFVNIAELSEVNLPEVYRNKFDATTQDKDIDANVLGVLRRSDVPLKINLLLGDASHDHLTGLYKAQISNSVDGYRFTSPDASMIYVHSGQVQKITPHTPTDGKQEADVMFVFSGKFTINGVVIG